jgi:hypothetical protein
MPTAPDRSDGERQAISFTSTVPSRWLQYAGFVGGTSSIARNAYAGPNDRRHCEVHWWSGRTEFIGFGFRDSPSVTIEYVTPVTMVAGDVPNAAFATGLPTVTLDIAGLGLPREASVAFNAIIPISRSIPMRQMIATIFVLLPFLALQTGCRSCRPCCEGSVNGACAATCDEAAAGWGGSCPSGNRPRTQDGPDEAWTAGRFEDAAVPPPPDIL